MITKTRQKARPFAISRWSVQRKLVLAFWLVSVIPTMIAAELAATTLSQIFDSNVRIWLQESTKIVKDEISEILADNARVAKLFLQYTHPQTDRTVIRHERLTADIADATDILFDGHDFHYYKGKRLESTSTHGTGCSLSSAIASNLANGLSLPDAVGAAKEYVFEGIAHAEPIGKGHGPIHHFYELYKKAGWTK